MRVFLVWMIVALTGQLIGDLSARQVELDFPGLKHRVKVFLPEGHDPTKKYPTIFFYHGAGGEPDTSMLRHHTRDKGWIIVGMAYYQLGPVSYDSKSLGEQKHLMGSVRNYLKTKYGLDPQRCYVAGFSKGGWLSDMLLQSDPSLAGGVILGAGHLDQVKSTPSRHRKNKPVFIGIGRKDPNYPFALQAVTFHRKLGAATTFESWLELGHTLPEDGSHGLHQWLAIQANTIAKQQALSEMQEALKDAQELKPLARWDRLRHLRDLPYSKLLGEGWRSKLSESITVLEQNEGISKESEALNAHRKLIRQEIQANTLENMLAVHPAYLQLSERYEGTRQAKLAFHDYERTARRIQSFAKQKGKAAKKSVAPPGPATKPEKIDLPTNRRRIPDNPLIR